MRFTKPKKGGIELPTLSNPASAENVQSGFEVIGANGNKITGTHEEEPGLDTSDATATAANIDSGKTAYINGVKVTGTSNKVDTSDANATAADISKGKTAYGKSGKVTGTGKVLEYLIVGTRTTSDQFANIQVPNTPNFIRGGGHYDNSRVQIFVDDKCYAEGFSGKITFSSSVVNLPGGSSMYPSTLTYAIGRDNTL